MNCVGNNDDFDTNQAMMYMIEINTIHLSGLRTTCSITENLTQKEIRSVENKLIKLFGKQSFERQLAILNNHNLNVPSLELKKWLYIVGLNENLIQTIINRIGDEFDNLLNLNQTELDELMIDSTNDEKRKFNTAMNNLKLFIEKLKLNDTTANDLDLHWDSWDQSKLENIIEEDDCATSNNNSNQLDDNTTNSPYSPLDESKNLIVNSQEQLDIETPNSTSKSSSKEFNKLSPSTPPPPSYYYDNNYNNYNSNIPKSKSHEDQLTNKIDLKDRNPEYDSLKYRRKRLESEPCTGSNMLHNYSNSRSPIVSPDNLNNAQSDSCFEEQTSLTNSCTNVTAPRSPRGQGMLHAIKHRFTNRLKPKATVCNLCNKPLLFGFKCKEKKCKYKCHKECISKVPPSCGLPPEFFIYFKEAFQNNNCRSPISTSLINQQQQQSPQQSLQQQHSPQAKLNKKNKFKTNIKKSSPDSSSNASSRNSSAPPSPIQPNMTNNNKTLNSSSSSLTTQNKSFTFNDNNQHQQQTQQQQQHQHKLQPNMNTDKNDLNDNKQIVNKNLNNLNSQTSDYDSQNANENRQWPRQNSLTIKEWDIPFDEIIKEKEIGKGGRFGTVFKGKWHGQVVIKMFNMVNGLDDKKALEAFKDEVATFRKTRHENLVLFMGSCMSPPHLAIVTSYCKGLTLYNHLYERKDKFNLNRIISIGGQISQGMGYLHARGIIHKDLRSKNIFYDNANNKVTISDFGFFSLTKLCFSDDEHKDRLKIPKGWLCYLAPELIKSLRTGNGQEQEDLPFSFATDMFSFGTIWHELIFLHPPFEHFPAEVVIWQVGKGIKQSLVNLNASKEIKDILMLCWAYKPNERPEFSKLVDILTNLPKKRLQRSPSHPTHLMTNKLL